MDPFILLAFLQESGSRSCLSFVSGSVNEFFYYCRVGFRRCLDTSLLCREVGLFADRHAFHKRGATGRELKMSLVGRERFSQLILMLRSDEILIYDGWI